MKTQRVHKLEKPTNWVFLFLLMFCVLCTFILSVAVTRNKPLALDNQAFYFFSNWVGDGWIPIMEGISSLASKPVIIGFSIAAIIALWIKKKDYAGMLTMLVFVISGDFVNKLLKGWIQRDRPLLESMSAEGYSFPSGHVTVGFIMYGLIAYFIYQHSSNSLGKLAALYTAAFLMILIGISRLVMREHYLTDVLAGYSLGGLLLLTAIAVYQYIRTHFIKQK